MTNSHNLTLLVAYDGTPTSRHALMTAAELFPGARAEIVHAWRVLFGEPDLETVRTSRWSEPGAMLVAEAGAKRALVDEATDTATKAGLVADGREIHGRETPSAMLLDAIDEDRPDLVVVGTRRHPTAIGALGSMARAIVGRSPVPVLVVPGSVE